jgi:peptide/nickel transport system substrate-binding protein
MMVRGWLAVLLVALGLVLMACATATGPEVATPAAVDPAPPATATLAPTFTVAPFPEPEPEPAPPAEPAPAAAAMETAEATSTPTITPTPTPSPTPTPVDMGSLVEEDGLLVLRAQECGSAQKIREIAALDELTVQFTMCAPDPAFRARVAFEAFGIQPREHFRQTGGAGELLENPIGTGPYRLARWNRGESIVLRRFDDYWGEPARDGTMVIRWEWNAEARLQALLDRQVDQIHRVRAGEVARVEEDADLVMLRAPGPNIFYLGMINTVEPFDNPDVRRAIAMGIDRQRIVEEFFSEGSEVANYFTPCTIEGGCEGEQWYPFNPGAARALLAAAGYPAGFETVIYYRDVYRAYLPRPGAVALELQSQLEEHLGIRARVVLLETDQFLPAATAGTLNGFYLLGWTADYPHPDNFLSVHFGESSRQFGEPYSEIYDPLGVAAWITNGDTISRLYGEANRAIRDLVPAVPIAHGVLLEAARDDAEGAHVRPFGSIRGAAVDTPGATFIYMGVAEPESLYCADETDGETLRACAQVVESLLAYALDSTETVPALATGCESDDRAAVWTCSLREGVLFHDGSAFDANDVVMSYAVGLDVANPYHTGRTGNFYYFSRLWGLINEPPP